ncbi:MAG TPA: hypothetical protein V6D05_11125 [Stenomitos sp.]
MSIQAVTATRLGPLPTMVAPVSSEQATQSLGMAPDQLALGVPAAPAADLRAQGGVLDWFVGVIDVLFGRGRYDDRYGDPYGGYPDYRRYPVPAPIPPETSYGRQLMSILDDYDRQMEMLNQQYYRMPNQTWARRERNLWEQTCERIVRSYAPREEKLAALGHVHNSSSMPGAAYQEYARQVGGYPRY